MFARMFVGCSALILTIVAFGSTPVAACYLGDCDSRGYYETPASYTRPLGAYTPRAYGYTPSRAYYSPRVYGYRYSYGRRVGYRSARYYGSPRIYARNAYYRGRVGRWR